MKNKFAEFLIKFLIHSTIFGCLIYYLTNFTIQKQLCLQLVSDWLCLSLIRIKRKIKKYSMDIKMHN